MASDNLSSRIKSPETSPTTSGIRSGGQPIPRSGLQTDPLVAGKYIAYVDDGPNGQFIRKLDTSIWNYVVAQDSSGGIKSSMDKNLVWLNSLTKRLRYQSSGLGSDPRHMQGSWG